MSFNGSTGYLTIVDPGSGTATVSYSIAGQSGSFTVPWPTGPSSSTAFRSRAVVADAGLIHNDFSASPEAQAVANSRVSCQLVEMEEKNIGYFGLFVGAAGYILDWTGVGLGFGVVLGAVEYIVSVGGVALAKVQGC